MKNIAHIINQHVNLTHDAWRIFNTLNIYNTTRTDIHMAFLHRNIKFVTSVANGMFNVIKDIMELEDTEEY